MVDASERRAWFQFAVKLLGVVVMVGAAGVFLTAIAGALTGLAMAGTRFPFFETVLVQAFMNGVLVTLGYYLTRDENIFTELCYPAAGVAPPRQ